MNILWVLFGKTKAINTVWFDWLTDHLPDLTCRENCIAEKFCWDPFKGFVFCPHADSNPSQPGSDTLTLTNPNDSPNLLRYLMTPFTYCEILLLTYGASTWFLVIGETASDNRFSASFFPFRSRAKARPNAPTKINPSGTPRPTASPIVVFLLSDEAVGGVVVDMRLSLGVEELVVETVWLLIVC